MHQQLKERRREPDGRCRESLPPHNAPYTYQMDAHLTKQARLVQWQLVQELETGEAAREVQQIKHQHRAWKLADLLDGEFAQQDQRS